MLEHDPAPLVPGAVHVLWSPAPQLSSETRSNWLDQRLRRALAPYVGCAPDALSFSREARGRPYLRIHAGSASDLDFNLSHTEGGCVIAVARARRVGIDLERSDRRMPALRLARRYFAADEAAALATLGPAEQARAFVHAWTAKEACCKATGSGLAGQLAAWRFACDSEGEAPQLLALPPGAGEPSQWQLRRLTPEPGYTAALAVNGTIEQLVLRVLAV